jgi:hypothetical protein
MPHDTSAPGRVSRTSRSHAAIESRANPGETLNGKRFEKAIMREFIKEGEVVYPEIISIRNKS